jgi:hypothetical protein
MVVWRKSRKKFEKLIVTDRDNGGKERASEFTERAAGGHTGPPLLKSIRFNKHLERKEGTL